MLDVVVSGLPYIIMYKAQNPLLVISTNRGIISLKTMSYLKRFSVIPIPMNGSSCLLLKPYP